MSCIRRLLTLAVATMLVGMAAGQDAAVARLTVTVPADARLYFDGQLTQQTGTTRSFVTPLLQGGQMYSYDLRADVVRNGQVVSQTQHVNVQAGSNLSVDFSRLGMTTAAQPPADTLPDADTGWPRTLTANGTTITIYQPQIDRWERNLLEARAAVALETQASPQPVYGVVSFTARTEVDKEHRQVHLDDIRVVKTDFPVAPDKAKGLVEALRKQGLLQARTIALDRLEANLAVTQAESRTSTVPVKNEPPRIIVSDKPAVLILIDGEPALRQVEGSQLLRVINTRGLILMDQGAGTYYLRLPDRWLQAPRIDGPWTVSTNPPASLAPILQKVENDLGTDQVAKLSADVKDLLAEGGMPTVYVSTKPAELIETRGAPEMAPIEGTKLLWVKNSTNQIVLDTSDQRYYVLLSGRWFRAPALQGPWEFVAADKLPAEFAKIPTTHPRGDVLSSVAGTPQAHEAVIANGIPQTAVVQRKEAKLEPLYDGDPQFKPIEGTPLQYAVNSPTPVIQTAPQTYYAVENGIWFTAPAPTGPWVVVDSVPQVIYTIPPSSPVNYVTYSYVYGGTPDVVYVGYTPGYLGTCLCPQGVVVYGTGWAFTPWVGRYWFGRPWTYGWGVRFGWTAGGWGFGFGTAWGRPWWGPVGWHAGWGGSWWRDGWHAGWGGRYGYAHVNNVNFNNFNVYNRWGNNVHVNNFNHTQIATNRQTNIRQTNVTANVQRNYNNVVAGRDNNVYRRSGEGWETHTDSGWRSYGADTVRPETRPQVDNNVRNLNNEWSARRAGEASYGQFRTASGQYGERSFDANRAGNVGGYGGFHSDYGGFRSYGGSYGGFRAGSVGGFHGGRR